MSDINAPETLEGIEIETVDFDKEKAKLTMENPDNDWSGKITDGIGGE